MQVPPSMAVASTPNPTMTPGDVSASGIDIGARIYPGDGAIGVALNPTFEWRPVDGAIGYDFRLSEKPDFTETVDSAVDVTTTIYTASVMLKPQTVYYWQVREISPDKTGDWISSSFTTGAGEATMVPAPKALDGANRSAGSAPNPAPESNAAGAGGGPAVTNSDNSLYDTSGIFDKDESQLTKNEKLMKILTENYEKRRAILETALEKANPDVRPAIRQAIAQNQAEYEKAMNMLLLAENNE
jgi:hypothetical protein